MSVIAYTRYALTVGQSSTNRPENAFLYFRCDTEAERPTGADTVDGDAAYTVDSGKRWDRVGGAWVLRTTDNLAGQLQDASGDVFDIEDLTDGQFLKRSGSSIVSEAIAGGGDLLAVNNLDDLDNVGTARTNLGLGSAATTASTAYATAAQGTTADSALQPAGNGSTLTGLTKGQVSLGNADNTSDENKPVSTAQQTALDLKANIASPTFTGTVGGITATMVGAPAGSGTSSGTNTGDNATNTQYSGLAASKQDTLVSGTNIKTINSTSLLGAGDIVISGSGLTQPQVMARGLGC